MLSNKVRGNNFFTPKKLSSQIGEKNSVRKNKKRKIKTKKNRKRNKSKKNKIGGGEKQRPENIPIELRIPAVATGYANIISNQDKFISSFWENGKASFTKNTRHCTLLFSNSETTNSPIEFDNYALNSCVRSSSNTLMPNLLARNKRIDLYFEKQLVASLDIKNKYDQVESWIRDNSTEHAKCNT